MKVGLAKTKWPEHGRPYFAPFLPQPVVVKSWIGSLPIRGGGGGLWAQVDWEIYCSMLHGCNENLANFRAVEKLQPYSSILCFWIPISKINDKIDQYSKVNQKSKKILPKNTSESLSTSRSPQKTFETSAPKPLVSHENLTITAPPPKKRKNLFIRTKPI